MIETKNILEEALSEALEKMAFLTILPMDEEIVEPVEMVLTKICFTGPKNGTLLMLTGQDLGEILVENFGAVCEADDESSSDAFKELLNVTCGLLLPFLVNLSEDVFDVTVPETFKGQDLPRWQDFISNNDTYVLNAEGHLIAVRLTFE